MHSKYSLRQLALVFSLVAILVNAQAPDTATEQTPYPLDAERMMERAKMVTADKHPDAHYALVDDFIYAKYEKSGTYVMWDDMAYKILTQKGRDQMKTLSTYYTASYGKSQFILVNVHKPDGKVISYDPKKLSKEMVDPSQMSSNIYDPNHKIVRITLPELEIGDVIRYCVKRDTFKPRYPNSFSNIFILESDEPIVNYTILVDGPEELPLNKIALRDPVGNTVKSSVEKQPNGRIHYRWDTQNVPGILPEPQMPSLRSVAQRLIISTINSWNDVSKWYWNLCQPRMKTTPEMKEKVQELVKGLKNRDDIIKAIFQFVSQEIRYMGITVEKEAPGYEPHDVALTFNNRHGVCRDKAALLVAMLQLAGIQAFPVLIMAGDKIDNEVPLPYFNHAVTAALDEKGNYILMDSTDENTKDIFPQYLADMSYLVARQNGDTLRTSPFSPAKDNMLHINTAANVNEEGKMTAKSTITFYGINDNAYRGAFANSSPDDTKAFIERLVSAAIPGSTVTKLELKPASMLKTDEILSLYLEYSAERFCIANASVAMLTPPSLARGFGMSNFILRSTQLDSRKYPFRTKYACGISEKLDLKLHPVWGKPASLPEYAQIDDELMTWKRHVDFKKQQLTFNTDTAIKVIEFSPKQYLTLKDHLKLMDDNARKVVVLKREATDGTPDTAGLDVEVINETTSHTLTNATTWMTTQNVKMKILSYKGKKENAELTFNYNPAWQTVKLEVAEVTTPVVGDDGKTTYRTQVISDKEINIMDASWVAGAPRYPAGKILVASLPGVEVGSIIHYKVTITNSGKPFFSLRETFRATNASTKSKTVIVNTPAQLKLTTAVFQNGLLANTFKAHQSNISERFVTENNRTIWTWSAANQPAIPEEPHQAPDMIFTPTVFCSARSWNEHFQQLKTELLAKTQPGPELLKLAESLKKLPDEKRLKAVNTFIARSIKSAGPSFLSLPLTCMSTPDTTIKDGYGNNADKAIAAYALLKELGYEPEFIFTSGSSLPHAQFQQLYATPSPWLFANIVVRVVKDDATYWFNDQNQYANIQTTNNEDAFAMTADAKFFTVTIPDNYKTTRNVTYDIVLDDNGNATLTYSDPVLGTRFGTSNKLYSELTPEYRKRNFLSLVKQFSERAVPTSELITDFLQYPGRFSFTCAIPQFAVKDGNFLYFKLPVNSFKRLPLRFNTNRTTPMMQTADTSISYTFNVTLPPAYKKWVMTPQNYTWESPDRSCRYNVNMTQPAPDKLTITYKAKLVPEIITPDVFANYKKLADTLSHDTVNTILLTK